MKYLIFNLILFVFLEMGLLVLMLFFIKRGVRCKQKNVLEYFIPTLLSLFIVFILIYYIFPRTMDLKDYYFKDEFGITKGKMEEISFINNSFVVDGIRYYQNPLNSLPDVGEDVEIKYCKASHFALNVDFV